MLLFETQEGEIVCKLLDLDSDDLYRNLLKPKIKVGNEFVTQGRTKDQVILGKLFVSTNGGQCQKQILT